MKKLLGCVIAAGWLLSACQSPSDADIAIAAGAPSDPQALIAPLRAAAHTYQADTTSLHATMEQLVSLDGSVSLAQADALVVDARAMDADIDRLEQLMNDAIQRHEHGAHALNTGGAAGAGASAGSNASSNNQSFGSTLGAMQQMQATDQQQAQTIAKQIQDDARKQTMERGRIQQDVQTKIFELQQDISVNKARTMDKAYQRWDEYIRQ